MNSAANTTETENTFRITLANGAKIEIAPRFDRRVEEVIDGKIFCRSAKAARDIASEINAWNCNSQPVAWSLGHGVVFWQP
jgi:hypothetical protein